MIPKDFDAITKADIDSLVVNAVAERRNIEYKQQLPGGTDDDKKEFLADVSSFANAAGGDIIYGITEQRDENGKATGIPEKAEGLAEINTDAEKRRLEDIIRAGIDPRLPGLRINHYDGFAAGPVILIRVPKSWVSPHMVIFKNHSRFFTRNSAGKYQLDVREIRAAFTASGDLRGKISTFHAERLGKIIANETPVNLPAGPKIILHLVPLTILDPIAQIDLAPLIDDLNIISPLQFFSKNQRINFDGYLSYSQSTQGTKFDGYVQVFRSGVMEAVDAELSNHPDGSKIVHSFSVEQTILEGAKMYFKAAKKLGIPLPLVVMATFTGLKDFDFSYGLDKRTTRRANNIDRDILLFPDVMLEDYGTQPDLLLRPVFDAFWQSAGFKACQHYNEKGRWDGRIPLARR